MIENRDFPLKFAQLTTFYLLILKQKFKWLLIDRKQLLPHFLYFENTRGKSRSGEGRVSISTGGFPPLYPKRERLETAKGGRKEEVGLI